MPSKEITVDNEKMTSSAAILSNKHHDIDIDSEVSLLKIIVEYGEENWFRGEYFKNDKKN